MVTADKDSQTLFGNVTMANSADFEAQLSSGTAFGSTLGSLPVHTEFTSIGFSVGVNLVGPGEDANNIVFTMTVDGQSVPLYIAWVQPGLASVSMALPMLPHTSGTAGISLTVSEPGSSDTFDVTTEEVVADQDAWIDPIQTDMYRDNDQPAIFDLVRGDDNGTPRAPSQPQDIYFNLAYGGYTAGLVNSDGSITPIDPDAAYADFGITVAGQNGGVTYDPNTGLFKTTIPANQSTVELDFIPTNPPGVASVNPFIFQVDLQGSAVTDPSTQIGFESNEPQTNPATQPAVNGALHGLVAVDDPSTLDPEQLAALLSLLDSDDPTASQDGVQQLEALVEADPTPAVVEQLLAAAASSDANVSTQIENILRFEFPFGMIQLNDNNNTIGGIVWPQAKLNLLTSINTKLEVTLTSSTGSVIWDDPTNSNVFDVEMNPVTQQPEGIQIDPKTTGQMMITITMQWMNQDNEGDFQNTGDPLVQRLLVDIVDTNP